MDALETPLRILGEPPEPVTDLSASTGMASAEVEQYFQPQVLDHCVLPQFEYGVATPVAGTRWVSGNQVPVKPQPALNPYYAAEQNANATAQYKALPTPGRGAAPAAQIKMDGRSMKEPLLEAQAPASAPPMNQL